MANLTCRSCKQGLAAFLMMSSALVWAQYFTPRSQIEDFGQLGAAPRSVPRPLATLGVGLIMEFEGWRPTAYDDPVGLCTIGFGHLIALNRCSKINLGKYAKVLTYDEGSALLELDTRTSRSIVEKLVTRELDEREFSALSSFAFNVGKENFASSTLLKLVNMGAKKFASAEFSRWVMAKGKVFKGLQDRRACESALFLGSLEGDANGNFKRSECVARGAAPSAETLIDIEVGEH